MGLVLIVRESIDQDAGSKIAKAKPAPVVDETIESYL
jgi:hypothetical protein